VPAETPSRPSPWRIPSQLMRKFLSQRLATPAPFKRHVLPVGPENLVGRQDRNNKGQS
jgi:hypothetical protein